MFEAHAKPRLRSASRAADRALFFRSWLRDPFNVASVIPSGKLLAKLMAKTLHPGARVIELGAGTGTLTDAILAAGVYPEDLYLVEQHPAFVDVLRRRFPASAVLPIDAQSLDRCLAELAGTVDFVVSGLPIVWFDRAKKARILAAAFALLRDGGSFHQFTYLGRPPVGRRLLAGLGLEAELMGISPINVPPAFVYRFRRGPDAVHERA